MIDAVSLSLAIWLIGIAYLLCLKTTYTIEPGYGLPVWLRCFLNLVMVLSWPIWVPFFIFNRIKSKDPVG